MDLHLAEKPLKKPLAGLEAKETEAVVWGGEIPTRTTCHAGFVWPAPELLSIRFI